MFEKVDYINNCNQEFNIINYNGRVIKIEKGEGSIQVPSYFLEKMLDFFEQYNIESNIKSILANQNFEENNILSEKLIKENVVNVSENILTDLIEKIKNLLLIIKNFSLKILKKIKAMFAE